MIMDILILLVMIAIGGPVGLIVRKLYNKKEKDDGKFASSGTYVRDDSLYSYDSKYDDSSEQKNNS